MSTSSRAQDLRSAEADLLQGRGDAAIASLRTITSRNPGNGPAYVLLCRAFLSELRGKEAADACRTALRSGVDQNADAQDWAGRAFGMEAEHAGPVSGLKLAGQVRSAFAAAHSLNPRSAAAANDLGEYYVNAPFLVGGGLDKALALAREVESTLPEIAHRLRALTAEKRDDLAAAEREFLAATQVAQSPGAYVDLANFYGRRGNAEKASAAARRAIMLDRATDANVVDAATALSDAHQAAPAIDALRAYLDHGQHSDAAPVFRAHTLLGDLLRGRGDTAGARHEYQAALALASGYGPAQKGLGAL